jgi:hypothetical protein
MATLEEQYAAMAGGDPTTYANAGAVSGENGQIIQPGAQLEAAYNNLVENSPAAVTKASRMITNVPELRGGPNTTFIESPQPPSGNFAANAERATAGNGPLSFLQPYEARLAATNDFMSKQAIMNELQTDAMQRIGNAQKVTTSSVENKLGLPPLRAQLARMIQEDSRDRELQGTDSQETSKLRMAVLKMEEAARKTTQDILSNNPELKTFTSAVTTTLKTHERMAEKAFNDATKLMEKKEAEKEASAQIVSSKDTAAREYISALHPAMKNDIEYAKFITKGGGSNKEWQPIVDGTIQDSDYVTAYLATDNKAARMLAASEEARRTGRNPNEIDKDLKDADTLVKNPTLALEEFAKAGLFKSPKEVNALKMQVMNGDATTRKQVASTIIAKMPEYFQAKAIQRTQTVPSQEMMADPGFAEAYTITTQKKGAPATIVDAGTAWMNEKDISNSEKIRRQKFVSDEYAKSLSKRSGSNIFFPQMDVGRITDEKRKVYDKLTSGSISETFASKLGNMAGEVINGIPRSPTFKLQSMLIGEGAKTFDEFLSGLKGAK